MTGLPPTQEEIQQFLSDKSPNAWEKVVDRLLASPAYGERWGRHWLDVARYADSNGFKADETRPNIWRYRDYVIKAFNDDKPYDRFVKEQIAGDELYPGDHRSADRHGLQPPLDRRNQRARSVRAPPGDARRHDHRHRRRFPGHDVRLRALPRSQVRSDPAKDYYRLQAFFANTAFGDGPLPLADPEAKRKYDEQYAAWDAKTKDIRAEMAKIMEPSWRSARSTRPSVMTDEVQAVVAEGCRPSARRSSSRFITSPKRASTAWAIRRDAQGRQCEALCRAQEAASHVRFPEARAAARRPVHDRSERHRAADPYLARRQPLRRRRRSAARIPFDSRSERREDHAARWRRTPPAAAARWPPGSPIPRIRCPRA